MQSYYKLNIEALDKIHLTPGAELSPRIHLKIRSDFYNLPEFQYADDNETSSFCQSSDYQSNIASKSLKRRILAEQERLEKTTKSPANYDNHVSIHPNPANSQIRITSSSKPITEIQIFDLSGRSLIHQKTGAEINTIAVNVNALQSGVYIVQTLCGDQRSTEKLVIGK